MRTKTAKIKLAEQLNEYYVPPIEDIVQYGKEEYRFIERISIFEQVHVLVYADRGLVGKPGFTAVCLEYSLFCWESSEEYAISRLYNMVDGYVESLNKTRAGRARLFRDLGDVSMAGFWGLYRQLSYLLGEPENPVFIMDEPDDSPEPAFAMARVDSELLKRRYEENIEKSRRGPAADGYFLIRRLELEFTGESMGAGLNIQSLAQHVGCRFHNSFRQSRMGRAWCS